MENSDITEEMQGKPDMEDGQGNVGIQQGNSEEPVTTEAERWKFRTR